MTVFVCDLDGTLTPYAGGDTKSLYSIVTRGFKYNTDWYRLVTASHAKIAVSEFVSEILTDAEKCDAVNFIRAMAARGRVVIVSRNYAIVADAYMCALGVRDLVEIYEDMFGGEWEELHHRYIDKSDAVVINDDADEVTELVARGWKCHRFTFNTIRSSLSARWSSRTNIHTTTKVIDGLINNYI